MIENPRIAVLLPCYNEAVAIAKVVADFRAVLPEATVYVFDNNSKDGSAAIAAKAGAVVAHVPLQGKGNVVRRMFADVDADIYLMADADGTYDHTRARELLAPIASGECDTVIGTRRGGAGSFPAGHRFGNWMFNVVVGHIFGRGLEDIFSGYRSFSRRFAKSFPAHSEGFEIETEMSIYILEQRIPMREIAMHYGARMEGSQSKLRTYRDGTRILLTILRLFKESRPLAFFTLVAAVLAVSSLLLGVPVILEWHHTGLVTHLPRAILSMGIGLVAGGFFLCGLVLDSVARTYRETRHMRYLNVPTRR